MNKDKVCECGCGQPAPIAKGTDKKRGHIKGQPIRFIRGHNRTRPLLERFWEKVDKRGPDDCWEWMASTNAGGYGQLSIGSTEDGTVRQMAAHRLSYELHNGPIPDGMWVLHKCDNRPCINPAHFFLGTHQDNMADRDAKGRQPKGKKHGNSKLTPEKVRHIRTLEEIGMSRQGIAARFGVAARTISAIITGQNWKHVK